MFVTKYITLTFIYTSLLLISWTSFASNVFILSCQTNMQCQDQQLQQTALALSGGGERDFVIYDQVNDRSYHYQVTNITGGEFPGTVIGAYKVSDLSSEINNAVKEYLRYFRDPIRAGLNELSFKLGTINGQDVYHLTNFYSGSVNFNNIRTSLNTINSSVESKLAQVINSALARASQNLQLSLSLIFGSTVQINLGVSSSKRNLFYLVVQGKEATIGLQFDVQLIDGVPISNITAIAIVENGNVVFKIPVVNGNIDTLSLMGQTFSHTNPGSLRGFFQTINLDLTYYCNTGCTVTIVDINNDDVGEVHNP